ncbi:hypothetical protein P3T36_000749 [Kitasatospora sp. MAP12-15]|uniref:hypothetical protein n=1 Tax=unclassified Kitasatospora TaxID=2633591 RepID=UPI002475A3F5|nr:hypothetical protein [Kitasatospora sp. MAP12-44]MDH6114348.1 hypothetical protein [Kitasatospora sp. MAP12-44]
MSAEPEAISLTPPSDLLDASDTVYPVYVDPTYSPNYGNNAWSSPSAAYPNTNYWNNTVDPTAGISQIGNSGIGESMSLFNFTFGSLSGATIYGAYFGITETHSWSCQNRAVDLYAPSAALNSSNATWNSWAGNLGSAIGSQSFAYGYTGCPASAIPPFNVTGTIANDVSNGKSTQTLAMRSDNSSDNYAFKEFQANTANLTITYDKTPNTPGGLYTSPATNCQNTTLGDTAVSLYAPVSTPTNSSLTTTFDLYKSSDSSRSNLLTSTNGINSDAYTGASGQAAVLPVPESLFKGAANGAVTSFTWQVQASDGNLTSGWSSTCTFNWDPTRPGAPTITVNSQPPSGAVACATVNDTTDTVQQVGSTCSFSLTPPNGAVVSGYQYQLNQSPPVTISATGATSISVPLPSLVNSLTVNALSAGGNLGSATTVWFDGAKLNPPAKDGDLTLDGTPDLIVPGNTTGVLPSGLWLMKGNSDGTVSQNPVNIGSSGLAINTGTNAADWNGAQAVTGSLCGYGAQDVLAYFPSGNNAGGADIACSDGSTGPLHLGSPTSIGNTSAPLRIPAGSFQDANGNNATQLANAGNTSRQNTGLPDLLATINNQLVLFYSTTANGYSSNAQFGMCAGGCNVLSNLTSPDGTQDWNSWTITTAQLGSGTAMYLWNPSTGALDLWTGLALSTDGTTLTTTGQYTIATNWNAGKALLLRTADVTGNGIPSLWGTDASTGLVTTYQPAALANNPAVSTSVTTLSGPRTAAPTARPVVYDPDTATAEVFEIGTDGAMYHSYSTNGAPWSTWATMGGSFSAKPVAIYNPDSRTEEVFAVGTDGYVYHSYSTNAAPWSSWATIGSYKFSQSPAVVYDPATKSIELFGIGTDGRMNHASYVNGTSWSAWTTLDTGYIFSGSPSVVYESNASNIDLFGIGADGVMNHAYSTNGGPWSPWASIGLGHHSTGSPAAVYNPTNSTAEVFAIGTDGVMNHAYSTKAGPWSAFFSLDSSYHFSGSPDVIFNPTVDSVELFGIGTNGIMNHQWFNSGSWSGWFSLSDWAFSGTPATVYEPNTSTDEVFGVGTDGRVNHAYSANGHWWSPWFTIGTNTFANN